MKVKELSTTISDEKLTLQIGKLAPNADVAIFASLGETCVLVSLVVGEERKDIDYFPLYVDYVEKLYAGGKIKGSRWVKREGRPSDDAVLIRRLIDRGIRPLFPKGFKKEVQIVVTLLSVDGVNSPEIVAAIATSAALHTSSVPWQGPISTLRVGYVSANNDSKSNLVINPNEEVQRFSDLDLIVTSTTEKVVMIEAQANQIQDKIITDGIEIAHNENKKLIAFIEKFRKLVGQPKETVVVNPDLEPLITLLKKDYKKNIEELISAQVSSKKDETRIVRNIVVQIQDVYKDKYGQSLINEALKKISAQKVREQIIKSNKRPDNRGLDDVRELYVETSVLPRTHGSALFARGKTQVLSIATLGAPTLEQLIEGPEGKEAKKYMHHYFMPSYSIGEVGRGNWLKPREIGHGALAERAIEPILPKDDIFPYVIRIVSEVLSSNGSTSMAAVCGSSLSLMDAGVPIKAAVAGISIGLVWQSDKNYILLTDIAGIEDFYGDMDFKIAGTKDGVTAIQLDVKNNGLTMKLISEAFVKAKIARLKILEKMNSIIDSSRKEISQYAPKVVILTPPEDKIGEIIGPGGKNIRQIITKTGADINITEDGKVSISGLDQKGVNEAKAIIKNIYRKIEIGEEFEGTVKRILPFGAFVEILPGKEGLVHVSKLSNRFIKDPSTVVSIGQKIKVKVLEIDTQGRINLASLEALGQKK